MAAKRALASISRILWRKPLDRPETTQLLAGHEIAVAGDSAVHLPHHPPLTGGPTNPIFREWTVVFEPEHVWRLKRGGRIRSIRITPTGTVLVNRRSLLDTDFGSVQGVRPSFQKRRRVDVDIAIAPWSHGWSVYYEFVIHILAKLCWLRDTLDPGTWEAAKVCYPVFGTPYESQFLSMLGLGDDDLLDTKQVEPVPHSLIVSNLQRGHRLISPTKLASLRNALLPLVETGDHGRRIYLSRGEAKARRLLNEAEVRQLCSSYGLEIIEEHPESVEEQIRLFNEASLIVTTHGSGLTNLAWCRPGTRVIEMFTASFMSGLYFYVSQVLGLHHTYLVDEAKTPHHHTHIHKDLTVDLKALAAALEHSGA